MRTPSLIILSRETQPISYSIEAPGVGYYESGNILANDRVILNFTSDILVSSYSDQNKGVYLKTSSDKVSVIGLSSKSIWYSRSLRALRDLETFTVNEITDLSISEYEYFAVSVNTSSSYYNSSVLIVGIRNNTVLKLTVTQPVTTRVGDINVTLIPDRQYSFMINRLQTVYLSSSNDLTGTRIVTSNPVSIFSGHQMGRIDHDSSYLIEQMPPTVLWGNKHYFSPLPNHHSDYAVKVLAASDCVLNVYCNTYANFNTSLKSGKGILLMFLSNETCTVLSSSKILVVQFSTGDSTIMILVPPTVHYRNKISFFTFLSRKDYRDYERLLLEIHYIIIVLAQYYQPDMIYLVTRAMNKSLANQEWTPIKINNITEAYGTSINNVSLGEGQIIHTNKDALMSVMVYEYSARGGFGTASNAFSSIKS